MYNFMTFDRLFDPILESKLLHPSTAPETWMASTHIIISNLTTAFHPLLNRLATYNDIEMFNLPINITLSKRNTPNNLRGISCIEVSVGLTTSIAGISTYNCRI